MRFLTTFQIADFADTLVSLFTAFVLGTLIGAERQYRQRTAGLRTNVLVAVGAAAFVDLAMHLEGADGAVRVIAYVVSGIGFLGAGVIVHESERFRVRGLTSAACTFLAACLGIVCDAGQWKIVAVALALAFVLLTVGRRIERRLHRALGGKEDVHDAEPRQR